MSCLHTLLAQIRRKVNRTCRFDKDSIDDSVGIPAAYIMST